MNLAGRTVLLTGATGGLGHAIARACAARGARLVLTGRRADVLEPLAGETGGRAVAHDLSDRDALVRLVADAGDVDVLVANAAVPADGLLEEYDVAQIDRALDVNLRAPILLAHALVPAMVARGSGHIVLVSSLAGKVTSPGGALYSATKYGMRGFGLSLRADLRETGVGVSVVYPGFIRGAGMFAESGVELPGWVRTKAPEDVGRAVVTAIERNRTEVDVASLDMRIGAALGGVFPAANAEIQRRLGGDRVAKALAAAHRSKR